MSNDELSDLTSISSLSPVPSDNESDTQLRSEDGILKFFHKVPRPKTTIKLTNRGKSAAASATAASSKKGKNRAGGKGGDKKMQDDSEDSDEPVAKRVREPSPPHEYVLADNHDIAVSFVPICADERELSRLQRIIPVDGQLLTRFLIFSSWSCSATASPKPFLKTWSTLGPKNSNTTLWTVHLASVSSTFYARCSNFCSTGSRT